jgi:hypothetical protein
MGCMIYYDLTNEVTMWNQFRGKEEEAPFFQDDEPAVVEKPAPAKIKAPSINLGKYFKEPILGMTAPQRFLISTLLLISVCLLGSMFMILTGTFALF